jgi:RimJ/RimL family protein N-acetyltransferase
MIRTSRLLLRRLAPSDASVVQQLAGAREVAENTLHIPHPYPEGAAAAWIARQAELCDGGKALILAIVAEGVFVGAIGLHDVGDHDRSELGYWIGVPYWGRGYATEAGVALLRHGFEERGMNRIYATHYSRNPASGRVLQKIGMRHEGTMPQHIRKWGEYVDVECYGLLRADWLRQAR